MPKITDPTLKAQRVELGKSKRRGDITERVFKNRVKKLEEKQLELNEAEEDRRYQLYQARKRAEAKAKRDFKKQKKIVLGNVVFDKVFNSGTPELFVYDIWENVSGYNNMKVYIKNKHEFNIEYVAKYKQFRNQFLGGSDSWKFGSGDRIIVLKNTDLDAEKLNQFFRDGISHCVFTPIKQKILENINSTKSKDTMKKWNLRYNHIIELEKEYSLGVPEDKMIDVAIASGFKITIKDIIGRTLFIFNDKSKKGSLTFTNTRANHIDEGFLTLEDKGIELSSSEMSKKWNEIKDDFYMIQGDLKNGIPRKLLTLDNVWSVINPEKQYFDEMNKIASIDDCRFNATKYPEVNEFIKAGRIINSWNLTINDDKPTGHIDMPKAYTQFKKCSFYKGFLGVIHQWRSGTFDLDFINNHIGYYRFKIINFDNELLSKLGFVINGTYILPSVEIAFFMSLGMEVFIDAGVFGSSIDFEFTDDMLEKGEDGIPRYSRWSGILGSENWNRNYTFKSDKKWASHLKHELSSDNVFYWEDLGLCSVKLPIDNVYTTHHILGFITSYVRIQMIQTMMKFDFKNIVRVVMDGLYYKEDLPSGLEWFKAKELKDSNFSDYWYSSTDINVNWDSDVYSRNTLLCGAGGNGKTYKVLNDIGLNKILFVAPMNLLGKGVSSEYKIRSTTIHKLLGKECIPFIKENAYPPVILIDELTQISSDWIEEVFTMYPKSLILLAGDVDDKQWYQCRNGRPGDFSKIWKPHDVDMIMMDIDRRSLDDELRNLKIDIRNKMKEVFVDGDNYNETIKMTIWANKLNTISFDDAVKQFNVGDVWIAGTHAINNKLLENGVVSGWYKKGGHISYDEKENFEKRGSFTTHSFQGQTIEDKKVFISINSCFEYSMLYTAISRVRRFNQLVFVR